MFLLNTVAFYHFPMFPFARPAIVFSLLSEARLNSFIQCCILYILTVNYEWKHIIKMPVIQFRLFLTDHFFNLSPSFLLYHHSSQEDAIYGTYCPILPFQNLTTCHFSNLKSIDLVLSPSPRSLSLSSFVGALCKPRVLGCSGSSVPTQT